MSKSSKPIADMEDDKSSRANPDANPFQHSFTQIKTTAKLPKLGLLSTFAKGKFSGLVVDSEAPKPDDSTRKPEVPSSTDKGGSQLEDLGDLTAEISQLAEQREIERKAALDAELEMKLAMVQSMSVLPTASAKTRAFQDMVVSSMSGFKRMREQQNKAASHTSRERQQKDSRNERAAGKQRGEGGYKHKLKMQKEKVRRCIDY